MAEINTNNIPYPDFKSGDIIDAEKFDANNKALVDKQNEIITHQNGVKHELERHKISGDHDDRYVKKTEGTLFTEQLAQHKNSDDHDDRYALNSKVDILEKEVRNVVLGSTNAEVGQARVGADGTSYRTLKERVDAEYGKVNENKANKFSFDIRDFGAKSNDSSFDNLSAINSAILACYNNGGGEVLIPSDTFYIRPNNTNRIILQPGVSIRGLGEKSKLSVMADSGNYFTVIGHINTDSTTWIKVKDVEISNFTIDQSENLTCSIQDSTVSANRDKHLNVITLYEFENVTIKNMRFNTTSVNTIIAIGDTRGAKNIRVINNTFNFNRGITNNPHYDNTAVYIQCDNYEISDNEFFTTNDQKNGISAIECHFGNGKAERNKVFNYINGIHIQLGGEQEGKPVDVRNNRILGCRRGINLWTSSYKISGLDIVDNYILVKTTIDNTRPFEDYARIYGIGSWGGQIKNPIENLNIVGNNVVFDVDELMVLDWSYCSGIQLSEFNRDGVTIIDYKNIDIKNNRIMNSPVIGITAGGFDSSKTRFENVQIKDNKIINASKNSSVIPSSNAHQKVAIRLLGVWSKSNIKNNDILDLFSTKRLTYGISTQSITTNSDVLCFDNQIVAQNGTLQNYISGGISQSPYIYITTSGGEKRRLVCNYTNGQYVLSTEAVNVTQ